MPALIQKLGSYVFSFNPLYVVLAIAALVIGVVLWRVQQDDKNKFDFFDLLMTDGKADPAKCAFMFVLAFTTWMMVSLVQGGKMTEGYFSIYCLTWVAPLIANVVFHKKEMPNTVIETATTKTKITETGDNK